MSGARGFGVAAGLESEVATELAGRCEELGYTSMWSNDPPAASGIETLADFARGSAALKLGVGVLALDRNAPEDINAKIEECGLDRSRLVIGVGAGFSKKPLTRMREVHDELRVSPFAFLQTNTETAELLYGAAREFAGLGSGERLFDLYCGIGTIGLSMAADAGEVWGIESVGDAIVDAEANAELNGIGNARFRTGDARLGIRPLVEEAGKPDVVVLDPPRAGLSAKIVRRVLECEAKRIVYVSCNPTTMAPNVRQMVDAGYRLTRVRPVDMFPQTPHIECVALLERTPAA